MEEQNTEFELPVLKGYLLKENWYGKKSFRYFMLYKKGSIRYFEDSNTLGAYLQYKGSFQIDSETKI